MGFDYFGTEVDLRNKKLFLFDMDGTVYRDGKVFDGALDLFQTICRMDGRYVFITNNSSHSVEDYVKETRRKEIECDKDNFFTSAQATVLYLKQFYPKEIIYCQGTKSFLKELRDAGLDAIEYVDASVGIVVVGFDTELTSEKIRRTCEALQRDIPYIATNPDLACPVSFGFIPDCGSICGMIKNATGREPIYMGKPEPIMVEFVRDRFGYTREQTVVVGDRLYTDIATGINANVDTICVLTGEASVDSIKNGTIKPTYTFASVKEIQRCIYRGN